MAAAVMLGTCAPALAEEGVQEGSSAESSSTYTVAASLSCYIPAMGGVEFGDFVFNNFYNTIDITEDADGNTSATMNFGKGTGTIYSINFDAALDPTLSPVGIYDEEGTLHTSDDDASITYTDRKSVV